MLWILLLNEKLMRNTMKKILIVGAGYGGAVFGRLAAEDNHVVEIIDKKDHAGGHSYSYPDPETGVEIQKYGPHIFHTNYEDVYRFIKRFTALNNFINRVKAVYNDRVYSMPVNLHTINQFFGRNFSPPEAKAFIESKQLHFEKVTNFKEAVLSSLGEELYAAFFRDYTIKQWGVQPEEIAVSTAKRLPVRYNYDDNYFNDKYQGIPVDGYGTLFKKMLDHKNITLNLKTPFDAVKSTWKKKYDMLVYTGSIDEYFDYCFGALPYRTIKFERIVDREIQGNAVINYTDISVPFTRIHEHKWFTPERSFEKSVAFKEYSAATDSRKAPYYPVENENSLQLYQQYKKLAKREERLLLIGRLAQFKYFNMDQVTKSSMDAYNKFKKS